MNETLPSCWEWLFSISVIPLSLFEGLYTLVDSPYRNKAMTYIDSNPCTELTQTSWLISLYNHLYTGNYSDDELKGMYFHEWPKKKFVQFVIRHSCTLQDQDKMIFTKMFIIGCDTVHIHPPSFELMYESHRDKLSLFLFSYLRPYGYEKLSEVLQGVHRKTNRSHDDISERTMRECVHDTLISFIIMKQEKKVTILSVIEDMSTRLTPMLSDALSRHMKPALLEQYVTGYTKRIIDSHSLIEKDTCNSHNNWISYTLEEKLSLLCSSIHKHTNIRSLDKNVDIIICIVISYVCLGILCLSYTRRCEQTKIIKILPLFTFAAGAYLIIYHTFRRQENQYPASYVVGYTQIIVGYFMLFIPNLCLAVL
jgi:hypothetical protein